MRKLLFNHPTITPAIQMSVRGAVSAALAMEFAKLLNFQFPTYALIGAIIVTDLSPAKTRHLGVWRIVGSFIGAAVGAMISALLEPNILTIGLGVAIAMLLSGILRLADATKLAGYVCGITMLGYSEHPWSYALSRLLETTLGVAAAILVSIVPKLLGTVENSKHDDDERSSK